MSAPPITSDTLKGRAMTSSTSDDGVTENEPVKLKIYEYMVGHMPIQAQLTEEQAKAMGAVEPGTAEDPPEGQVPNKEAERAGTHMAAPDTKGADGDDPEALNKARDVRNRRSR